MKINAQLHKITNRDQFVASFLATKGKPTTGFADFGPARVHLATDFPLKKFPAEGFGFLPNPSFRAEADAKGVFSLTVPDALKDFRGFLIVYQQVGTVQPLPTVPPVPILQPVYRSDAFKLGGVKETRRSIFLLKTKTDDEDGLAQARADQIAADLKSEHKFDRTSITIKEQKLTVRISVRGADVVFNVRLRGATSPDLTEFVEASAEDIDIDLPGPDAIVGLCVSKDDIKKQLRRIIKNSSGLFNDLIEAKIPAALKSLASFTVHQIRFPVTGQKNVKIPGLPDQSVATRSVVPELTAGVPKKLF